MTAAARASAGPSLLTLVDRVTELEETAEVAKERLQDLMNGLRSVEALSSRLSLLTLLDQKATTFTFSRISRAEKDLRRIFQQLDRSLTATMLSSVVANLCDLYLPSNRNRRLAPGSLREYYTTGHTAATQGAATTSVAHFRLTKTCTVLLREFPSLFTVSQQDDFGTHSTGGGTGRKLSRPVRSTNSDKAPHIENTATGSGDSASTPITPQACSNMMHSDVSPNGSKAGSSSCCENSSTEQQHQQQSNSYASTSAFESTSDRFFRKRKSRTSFSFLKNLYGTATTSDADLPNICRFTSANDILPIALHETRNDSRWPSRCIEFVLSRILEWVSWIDYDNAAVDGYPHQRGNDTHYDSLSDNSNCKGTGSALILATAEEYEAFLWRYFYTQSTLGIYGRLVTHWASALKFYISQYAESVGKVISLHLPMYKILLGKLHELQGPLTVYSSILKFPHLQLLDSNPS
eukprot:Lankesteria_metandrocarpae@DN9106_c0_g1_i1.p1